MEKEHYPPGFHFDQDDMEIEGQSEQSHKTEMHWKNYEQAKANWKVQRHKQKMQVIDTNSLKIF